MYESNRTQPGTLIKIPRGFHSASLYSERTSFILIFIKKLENSRNFPTEDRKSGPSACPPQSDVQIFPFPFARHTFLSMFPSNSSSFFPKRICDLGFSQARCAFLHIRYAFCFTREKKPPLRAGTPVFKRMGFVNRRETIEGIAFTTSGRGKEASCFTDGNSRRLEHSGT